MWLRWLDVIRLRIRSLAHRDRVDDELDRELRSHVEQQIDEHVAHGMTPEAARLAALRAFGGIEPMKEDARDARGVAIIENLVRDLRYTLRGLLREPMLLLAATSSIALGAGGNIAVFSLAREFLLAAPDVRQPEELVQMQVSHSSHATYRRWLDLEASGALEHLAGYSFEKQINWFAGDAAVSITPMLVTANFFDVVGVPMARGRGFSTEEARAERDPRLAVVSHAFWQRELAADSGVVGRSIMLNGEAYTILGVLAPRLRSVAGLGLAPSVYVALNRSLVPEMHTPDARIVSLIGRLKADQSVAQARSAVDAVDRRLSRLEGDTRFGGVQQLSRVGALNNSKAGRTLGGFFALLSLVSLLVLLIACGNVAGLLIARGTARRREIAIRLAIGGTRSRLLQQFLVEGFWLALLGTACGLGLSMAFMRIVNGIALPLPLPLELHLAPDVPMLAAALGLVLISMLFCALLPALKATRLSLTPALKRDEVRHGRRFTTRGVLLAGQVTISTVLLVTAFLFVRNLARTQVTKPGFEVEHALVAQIGLVQGRSGDDQAALLQSAVERLQALPGVQDAAFANAVPLTVHSGSSNGRSVRFDDRTESEHVEYALSSVGPRYFSTLGIRVVQGREFRPADRPGAPLVVIVNEEFVRRYFAGASPVGHRLRFTDEKTPVDFEIIGVVANGKHNTIGEEQRAALYHPLLQHPDGMSLAFVFVRTSTDAATLLTPVRQAIGELDRAVAVEVKPMTTALAFAMLPSQIGAAVLGGLGTLGLVLATFGLYAIVAYNVSQRVGEIAIRSALGATRGRIVRLVIRDAAVLVGIGVTLGLGIAAFVTQPLVAWLATGLSATDPLSFGGTAVVFLVVSVLASWIPARQATRVSPVIAMRLE